MATFSSTRAAASATGRAPITCDMEFATITLTTTHANGDILRFCKLPKGSRVLGFQFYTSANLGVTNYNMEFGTEADTDQFKAAIGTTTAAVNATYASYNTDPTTADDYFIGKFTALTGGAAAGEVRVVVFLSGQN